MTNSTLKAKIFTGSKLFASYTDYMQLCNSTMSMPDQQIYIAFLCFFVVLVVIRIVPNVCIDHVTNPGYVVYRMYIAWSNKS